MPGLCAEPAGSTVACRSADGERETLQTETPGHSRPVPPSRGLWASPCNPVTVGHKELRTAMSPQDQSLAQRPPLPPEPVSTPATPIQSQR